MGIKHESSFQIWRLLFLGGRRMGILETVNQMVWGAPALILILAVGVYLTVRTGFSQLRLFPRALGRFFSQCKDSGSGYRALCTALAATVGTGNLAGVAGAIALGGPGAIFWMWICGILGMVIKFAEATLAIRYRQKNSNGEYVGGPMYMIQNGLGKRWNWLACLYAFFGVVASFGVGNATQINAVLGGLSSVAGTFGVEIGMTGRVILGVLLAVLITAMLRGGATRIGMAAERLVPIASMGYLLLGGIVLLVRWRYIPGAFGSIIKGAFSPKAATGGMLMSAFTALRVGVARGVFTNEAGMGTASIAHAGADVIHPADQGLMGIMEVFIDTIVICTMTALVILCSGVSIPYGTDPGILLTAASFSKVCGGWVTVPIAIALCLFALATVLGWGLYGIRCAQFLFGDSVWKCFVWLQCAAVIISATLGTGTVWLLAEIVNGLMAIPNLIAIAALSPELIRLFRGYKNWDC